MFVSQIIEEAMEMLGTTDKTKVYRKLSQAVRILMQSGHYFHTIAEVDVCTGWDKQTITLPRGIEVPLAVNVDGSPTYFRNRLFQYHVDKGGMYNTVNWAWDDRGQVATQMDIRQPSQLVAVAEHEADAGKMIRVVGTDGNNRELVTQTVAGTGMDGILIPIHRIADFPLGTIAPDGVTIETRSAKVSPLGTFVSATAHQLSSGVSAILTLVSGTMPPELEDGTRYYVGVTEANEVQLYDNELDAQAGDEPIVVSSIEGSPVLQLNDARNSQLYTVLSLTPSSTPPVPVTEAAEVTFSDPGNLPVSPLTDQVYYLNQEEPNIFQIYGTASDAKNRINPVLLTGSNSAFDVNFRKNIFPETKLVFNASHGYQNGDTVQAFTNGGTLPQPLVAGQNYYVHVTDSENEFSVTLHVNYADAISGENPINLTTTGVGQNSIAKLIPATFNPGIKNNINATGINLPAVTGSGAVVTAEVTGPMTSATLTFNGAGYTNATATVTDTGGYKYSITPAVSVRGGSPLLAATATATVATDAATGFGYVSSVAVNYGGQGYNPATPPEIVFSGGLSVGGFPARAEATITKGVKTGIITIPAGSRGSGYWSVGNQVIFTDENGSGTGAAGSVYEVSGSEPTEGVSGIIISKAGSNYSSPVIVGILSLPLYYKITQVGAPGSYINGLGLITPSSSAGIQLLPTGTLIMGSTTVSTIQTEVRSAINSNSENTLFYSTTQTTSSGVRVVPCIKLTVAAEASASGSISALYVTYLDNDGTNAGNTSAPLNILTSAVSFAAGDSIDTIRDAIVAKIGNGATVRKTTSDYIVISLAINSADVYVNQFYASSSNASLIFNISDIPIEFSPSYIQASLPAAQIHAQYNIQPTFPNSITTGVVSAINLLPYGTGGALSVSVNTITSSVSGINITQTGSGYQYPPRIAISAPNEQYPLLTVSSYVSSNTSAKITQISVLQTNGANKNLFGTTQVTSPTSLADIANKIVTAINAYTATSGYSAAISPKSGDTVILYPPAGIKAKNITVTQIDISIIQTIPADALVYSGVTTSFLTGYKVVNSGSGYTTPPAVTITGGGGSGAVAQSVIDKNGIGAVAVVSGGSGYPSNLLVSIVDQPGGTGSGATANAVVGAGGVIESINIVNNGQGYGAEPQIIFIDPAGSTGWPTVAAQFTFSKTGVVTNVNVVSEGTGYVSAPNVTLQPSTGVFVQFSSTGTLPSPLVQGGTYRAENPSSSNTFTLKNNDFSDVNITSAGSGTIFLVLSRTYGIGFTGYWDGDLEGYKFSPVKLESQYQIPITSPATDSDTFYFFEKVSNTRGRLWKNYNPQANPQLSVQIIPEQLGVGQTYLSIPAPCAVSVYKNRILPESTQYLKDGMLVQFTSTSGTLPAPLIVGTNYLIDVYGDFLQLKTQGGQPVVFTNFGNSQLILNVIRTFTAKPSSTAVIENCALETGDAVSVRPSLGDSLPYPLQQSTLSQEYTYYVKRIGENLVQFCATKADSAAGVPILLYSSGDSIDSEFYVDLIRSPILVKTIQHVEKPLTVGYVSLYAFDYGRSNDMALIGQYHPSEVNPKYRRIRIGKPCAWVRMAYRVKPPDISSDFDYIPLENERAVLAALHAIDLEDKDFLEQSQKYWQTALVYLRNETDSMDGHAMTPPQINNITYGDGTDPIVN